MIDADVLVTYVLVLLGFVLIPGPAVLLTLARASTSGTRAGVATGLGIAVGDIVHTVLAIVGISAIVMASATLFTLVKYAGAAYLVYLGVRTILEKSDDPTAAASKALTPRTAFFQAVTAEVLNPKSAMFFLAFLPQFVVPENGAVALQLLVLGVLFVLAGLFATLTVAVGAGRVGRFLRRRPVVVRWQGKVVGSVYCLLGLRIAMTDR